MHGLNVVRDTNYVKINDINMTKDNVVPAIPHSVAPPILSSRCIINTIPLG